MKESYNVEAYRRVFEEEFTWLSGFERSVRRYGGKNALIEAQGGRSLTYAALNREVNRFANALGAAGVGKGDIVLYQLQNSIEFAECYIAPQKLGAINSPLNFNLAEGEIARVLDHDHPAAFVYGESFAKVARHALSLAAHQPGVILCVRDTAANEALPEGHTEFEDFLRGASEAEPQRGQPANMYDEVTRLFTSGTTGLPKEIPLCSANELLSAHDVIMHFPLTPQDVTMNLSPWFHRGGLHSGGLTPVLYVGGTCVIARGFSAKLCLESVERYGISFLIGVPATALMIAARQERHPVDLSGLRGLVMMGAPLEKAACERFQRVLTKNIFNGYGTTETFWNSFLRPYDLPERAGSAGSACTDDEVRVIRASDEERVEPDELVPMDGETTGEIIIHSPMKSTLCYVDNPEMTQKKFYRGWLYTGDLGVWDENLYVTVCGRKDDMIVCKGENIYPAQIEEVLNQHPAVQECIVTGVPDGTRGQAIAAYVQCESPVTAAELNAFCTSHPDLSDYKCPRYYCFVDALPYTPTGKKRHVEIRNRAAEDLREGRLLRP